MRTGILLSVREKATRLPGKVLLPLGGYNVTEYLIRRLQKSHRADELVVSTSTHPRDEILVDIAKKMGVGYFKGSEDDKLLRYRDTARYFKLDFVVVVDGDDPFCSVWHIDRMIEHVRDQSTDYITWEGLPLGATSFGVNIKALECICEEKKEENTEIWGHLFTSNPVFKSVFLKETNPLYNRPDIRMTLDYSEDYTFFIRVAEGLQERNLAPDFSHVMSYLQEHPEVIEINRGVQQAYEEHLKRSL